MTAYLLMVGLPVLGLLGILEAGRGIPAPLSITGDWTLEFDPAAHCANSPGSFERQRAWSISQSGTEALITFNDGRATTLEATVNGVALTAKSLTATISGKPGTRTLEGVAGFDGCAPVAFRAVRQAPKKGGV
ncbi:MAG TPA: hypothetical protein VMQ86_22695 [Bryobacteraceae bacterium]|nr:hypothetical protein [Bryobacteraceae bacterium]